MGMRTNKKVSHKERLGVNHYAAADLDEVMDARE
jgi:hypothetical protein